MTRERTYDGTSGNATRPVVHPFCQEYFCSGYGDGAGCTHLMTYPSLGESTWVQQENWKQTEHHSESQQSTPDDGLVAQWLSGDVKLNDFRALEKKLKECWSEKSNLEQRIKVGIC